MNTPQSKIHWAAFATTLACVPLAMAEDIHVSGANIAAVEIPNAIVTLRVPNPNITPTDEITPLHVTQYDYILQQNREEYAFQAYLDTGTSGMVISKDLADLLNLQPQKTSGGTTVKFYDVTLEGTTEYNISQPYHISVGGYPLTTTEPEYNDFAGQRQIFTPPTDPMRLQIGLTAVTDPLLQTPINIVGMPAMQNRTMVVDSTLYNHYDPNNEEFAIPQIITNLYPHGAGASNIPATDHTIRLSYVDFEAFTYISPNQPDNPGDPAPGAPALSANPFIGRNPFNAPSAGDPPGISFNRPDPTNSNNPSLTGTGTWLLDTGAQFSFMSNNQAKLVSISAYDENGDPYLDGQGNPILRDTLTGQTAPGFFTLSGTGAGGETQTLLGFVLHELVVPTNQGNIIYSDLPIIVHDITLENPVTHELFTLDGDIGMNLFLPTMDPNSLNITLSAFDYMVFDQAAGELRLASTTGVPEPAAALMILALPLLLSRRTRSESAL